MAEENLPVRVGPPSEDKGFEQLKSVNQHGAEYWSARDLQPLLGYNHWRSFEKAVAKAITSCQQSGNDPEHHFARARKPIVGGKGAVQAVPDFHLSRFACYLVAQNGDPRKPEIALAQKYFAIQTRPPKASAANRKRGECTMETTKIAVFKGKEIRKTLHNEEWWFSVSDVVEALTDTPNSTDYIKKMRKRDGELAQGWGQIVTPLAIQTEGGLQQVNCANTEGIFRIIQSIPSPKAEPFKRWLARVGYERVQEIEDPEQATRRTRALYKAKGYSDAWIEKRMRGIAIREELTDEWKKRGVEEDAEYAILTAEISKAAFGLTPSEYKKLKGLKRENLRDHMTDLEQIFSILGEAATTEITRNKDAQGFLESKGAAREGGDVAGKARRDLESRTGNKVVSRQNYLQQPESRKLLKDHP